MSIKREETLKYVIEETMGDGAINIKVKFVYNTYLFGKLWKSEEIFDPIIFNNKEEAEQYAKIVVAPSVPTTLYNCSYRQGLHSRYDLNNVAIYHVYTLYDDILKDIQYNYDKVVVDNQTDYYFIYATGYLNTNTMYNSGTINDFDIFVPDSHHSEWTYFSGFAIKDILYNRPVIQNYYSHNWEDIRSSKSLKEKVDELSKYINDRIEKRLDEERKKRLSKTLVSTCETLVSNVNANDCTSDISYEISDYDLSRNKIIEDELKRVSDYQNFLKKLIR
ncbi:MAG: hypothetical protein [Wendovervirus sonii]|uniref:Uncharacterized protein n=1 Tax=phage Lak_Megaphage_Sonny TaxID=3109229 RepID=A0ABZ0Z2K9_9CAUD|nr:MAG: hypothetical protein [phage Lak_Megaphage_Sonny]